jgi:small subunit ribosomal protein S6
MGKYEILYIVHPDLEASIDKITGHAREVIESRKGKINYEENWGKRKLAYPIKKADVGIYVLWYFEAPQSALAKIERDFRLTEEIIRYMILATPDKAVKPAKKPKAEKVAEVAEAKEEAPAEDTKSKKAPVKKTTKAAEKAPQETEKVRMKKLDEQLGALLGEEEKKSAKK